MIRYRVTAGAEPRQGNSSFRFVADQPIDARAETKDSPRRTFGYAVKYANQSLITDVSRLRPHRCTIIASITSREIAARPGCCTRRA